MSITSTIVCNMPQKEKCSGKSKFNSCKEDTIAFTFGPAFPRFFQSVDPET